ncbi:MAG: hypothetical protein Q9188_007549 [Gyalolechia gomerana]
MWLHVRARFCAYQPNVRQHGQIVRRRIKKKEPGQALNDARKALKHLQRANDGHLPNLQGILNRTYGRVGKRSRQLMAQLQAPDSAVAELSEQISQDSKGRKKVPQLSDEVLALVKSQIKLASSRFPGAALREIQPSVPAVNSWGRPFPEKRKVNFIKKWHAATLARLMPPLPAPEWDRLQGLSTGNIPWDGPVPRRKLGTTLAVESRHSFDRLAPGHLPHRLTSSTERIVDFGRHDENRTNPHELTPRLMRSLWSQVFQACPRLDWSLEKKQWLVTWGHRGKKADLVLNPQRVLPAGLFDGVNDRGKVVPAGVRS